MDRIEVDLARSTLPTSGGSGGSYGASNTCTALYRACQALRERVYGSADAEPKGDLIDAALKRFPGGIEVDGAIPAMNADPRFKQFSLHTYGATFAEVHVNAVTAEVRVRRMLGVHDAGRIIYPMTARSQLVGGMLWGLSSALHDEAHVDPVHGNIVNCDLAEYLVPVHADIPEIDAIMLDGRDENANELGIKGVGELGACGAGAAIVNAVFNATGVRIRSFPITIDKLLAGLSK
jgi:xanthine dehydrogenase YagR molybdenum-binding subunit